MRTFSLLLALCAVTVLAGCQSFFDPRDASGQPVPASYNEVGDLDGHYSIDDDGHVWWEPAE